MKGNRSAAVAESRGVAGDSEAAPTARAFGTYSRQNVMRQVNSKGRNCGSEPDAQGESTQDFRRK